MNWAAVPEADDPMSRLFIHVEGEAEETFVKEVLARHLYSKGYTQVSARLIGNARQRDRRGGIKGWNVVSKEIINHLKEDPMCLATTMVDYYGLPKTGEKAWPGRNQATSLPFPQKAITIEKALLADIGREFGYDFNPDRFIPYVMMHEFEGMLFSDCRRFGEGIGHSELIPKFQDIRNLFATPEEINDSPVTAPSKRVQTLVPGYQKPLLGSLAAIHIGLKVIRSECPHFREWLARLEALSK
jgi:hypothetical protein